MKEPDEEALTTIHTFRQPGGPDRLGILQRAHLPRLPRGQRSHVPRELRQKIGRDDRGIRHRLIQKLGKHWNHPQEILRVHPLVVMIRPQVL